MKSNKFETKIVVLGNNALVVNNEIKGKIKMQQNSGVW